MSIPCDDAIDSFLSSGREESTPIVILASMAPLMDEMLISTLVPALEVYSSVVHINVLMCSILTLMKIGVIRAYILIIFHGLCSLGLFFIVNLYYERRNRRLI